MSARGDLRQIIVAALEQGWRCDRLSNGHYRLIPPDHTKRIIFASGTPSDVRGWRNFLVEMKRAGFQLHQH